MTFFPHTFAIRFELPSDVSTTLQIHKYSVSSIHQVPIQKWTERLGQILSPV